MSELIDQQVGDYRLIRLLDRGVYVDTYQGEHTRTCAAVVIKLFHTRLISEGASHFLHEARKLVALEHSHIVRVQDFDLHDGMPFLVQEALSISLRQIYPVGAQLPLSQAIAYVRQIGDALQYVHSQGLVHGDLRPDCLLLRPNDRSLVLSDVGLATLARSVATPREPASWRPGPYSALEQLQGLSQSASDQYALARLIYEWLCGELPLQSAVSSAISAQQPLPLLHEKAPGVPGDVEQVLCTALADEPARRFGSVQAFVKALEQASDTSAAQPLAALGVQPSVSFQQISAHPASSPQIAPFPGQSASSPGLQPQTPPFPGPGFVQASLPAQSFGGSPLPSRQTRGISRRALLAGLGVGAGALAAAGACGLVLKFGAHIGSRSTPPPLPSDPFTTYKGFTQSSGDFEIRELLWSPDSRRLLAVGSDDSIQAWDVVSGGNVLKWTAPDAMKIQGSSSWTSGGPRVAWVDNKAIIHVVDPSSNKESATYIGHSTGNSVDRVSFVAWSPDGTRIASVGSSGSNIDGVALVWDATTASTVTRFNTVVKSSDDDQTISTYQIQLAWSPDGSRILSWTMGGMAYIWDARSGKLISTYRGFYDQYINQVNDRFVPLNNVTWSPDGRLAVATVALQKDNVPKSSIHVWEAQTGRSVCTYDGHFKQQQYVVQLSWSPDSTLIASQGDPEAAAGQPSGIHVWNAATGEHIFTRSHNLRGRLAWFPKGKRIASTASGVQIGLEFQTWDATTGAHVVNYTNSASQVSPDAQNIVWSPDSRFIAAAGIESDIYLWRARE